MAMCMLAPARLSTYVAISCPALLHLGTLALARAHSCTHLDDTRLRYPPHPAVGQGLTRTLSTAAVAPLPLARARVRPRLPAQLWLALLGGGTRSFAADAVAPGSDAFTAGLQRKSEAELLELVQRTRAAALEPHAEQEEGEGEEPEGEYKNPETGELLGPRGKEPTRYGDWELKGKCVDF